MDVNELMHRVCNSQSPTPPDYIQSFMAFNAQSSEALKKERILREAGEKSSDMSDGARQAKKWTLVLAIAQCRVSNTGCFSRGCSPAWFPD